MRNSLSRVVVLCVAHDSVARYDGEMEVVVVVDMRLVGSAETVDMVVDHRAVLVAHTVLVAIVAVVVDCRMVLLEVVACDSLSSNAA